MPVLVLCLLTGPSEFVVELAKILTEVGKLIENKNMAYFLIACLPVTGYVD